MIRLEKVTDDNADDVLKLRVTKEQRAFLPTNERSLVDAYLWLAEGKPVFPFVVYRDKTPVGFIMLSYFNDWSGYKRDAWLQSDAYRFYKDKYFYYIWRLMIDKRYQGRGYGKEALLRAVEFAGTAPAGRADFCVISYAPENEAAKRLYASLGFTELNEPGYYGEDDEISAVLKL